MSLSPQAVIERLQTFLSGERGEQGESRRLPVLGRRKLRGPRSRWMWRWRTGPRSALHPVVVRLDMGGKIYEVTLSREEEFRVLAHAAKGGVPVPEPLWGFQRPWRARARLL